MNEERLIEKAEQTHRLHKEEIIALLTSESCAAALRAAADRTRKTYVGDGVHLRALIEFSNICKQNCLYCGLRAGNPNVERYRLSSEEIYTFAKNAKSYGFKTVVLQSGEASHFAPDEFAALLTKIKSLDLAITLSVGEKTREEYGAYKAAGADRYLLRIETTDRELYGRLHPGMSFDNRLCCLSDLKELGYEVGTGCLIGLPGQSAASLADDLLFFQSIDADMIGAGPFIPNGDTPLSRASGGALAPSLRFIALARLLMPDINLPATTALETLEKNARVAALQAGANVVMPNVTGNGCREKYVLYPGKVSVGEAPEASRASIAEKIAAIGRHISGEYGYRDRRKTLYTPSKRRD